MPVARRCHFISTVERIGVLRGTVFLRSIRREGSGYWENMTVTFWMGTSFHKSNTSYAPLRYYIETCWLLYSQRSFGMVSLYHICVILITTCICKALLVTLLI